MHGGRKLASWSGVIAASLGVHAAAFGGFGAAGVPAQAKRRTAALVEMTIAAPPPPPAPAAPVAAPAAPTARAVAPRAARPVRATPARARTAAPPEAPPAQAETPADFSGLTLTNDAPGAGWTSAIGTGGAMKGPVGRPGARVTHRTVDGAPDGAPGGGPAVVALGDLSQPPRPPDLAEALARAYPAEARRKGIAGKAVVRALVLPTGQLTELALVSETVAGFGAACERTLRGSRWSPPLDRAARAVSTSITYTCRFEVE